MGRILSIFNFRRWPWACVMCVAFLLIAEGVARRAVDCLATPSDVIIRYKEKILNGRNPSGVTPNIIIMGDSRVLGLHARELSQELSARLGREISVYNYAFPNHGVRGYHLLLKHYLRHHPRPEAIVFYSSPFAITGAWNLDDERAIEDRDLFRFISIYSLRECLAVLPPHVFLRALRMKAERLSVLIAYRARILAALHREQGFHDKGPWVERSFAKSWGGAIIVRNKAADEGEVSRSEYYQTALEPDPAAIEWFARFFALAREHGIPVVIANAPLVASVFEKRQSNGANRRYAAVMEDFPLRFDNVVLTDPLLEGWDISFFSDAHHLNREGFRRFSFEAAAPIADVLERIAKSGGCPLEASADEPRSR